MRYAIILALLLTACNITQKKVDDGLTMAFLVACAGVDPAHAAWQSYKASHKISVDDANKVEASYQSALSVCTNPPTSTYDTLSAALGAVVAFNNAMRNLKHV